MHHRQSPHDGRPPTRLQFSLRSLLIVMTFCCLGLSLLSYLSFPPVALQVLGVVAWAGLVVGQGASALAAGADYRRRRPHNSSWLRVRRRWAVWLASLAAVGPTITLLLFVVVFCCSGYDVDRIDRWFDEISGSAELGSRGFWFNTWMALALLNSGSALLSPISCAFYFRPSRDFALLLVRVFGLLSALVATSITLAFYVLP